MVDRNSRAAGAESSRSMVPAFVVRVDVPAGSIAHAHAPQSDRTAHSACAALIALCPTNGWTAISTLNAQAYGCFDLAEPTRAREVGSRAKTSTAAAGARLYGARSSSACLTRGIGSLSAEPRRSTESWLYLYNMTCGATHVSSVLV